MAGPWEKYRAPAAPMGDPVISGPDPYKQADEARDNARLSNDNARLSLDQRRFEFDQRTKADELNEKKSKFRQAREDAIGTTIDVLRQLDMVEADAKDNGGWFETGRSGAFVRSLPDAIQAGTGAYGIKRDVDMIDANTAFGALQRMRENSPTGGALGAVTENELNLLKSSIASLDPNLSQADFLKNIALARRNYVRMLGRIDPRRAQIYSTKRAEYERQTGQKPRRPAASSGWKVERED